MSQVAAGAAVALGVIMLGLFVCVVVSGLIWGAIFAFAQQPAFWLLLASFFTMAGWIVFGLVSLFSRSSLLQS